MEINNAETAQSWLNCWGALMRRVILDSAIDGQRSIIAICESRGWDCQGNRDAVAILEAARSESV